MKLVSKLAVLIFAAMLVSAVAMAAPQKSSAAGEASKASAEKTTQHQFTGTVVSIDAKAHTVTLKDDKGEEHTAPCMGSAIKELGSIKAGDKVTAMCKDNAKGEHLGVTSIKVAK